MKKLIALPYEVWRDIKDYEGIYQASNRTNFLSKKTGKLLKPYLGKNGYLYINLSKDGKQKHCYIHRIIAETFVPNPNNYETVDHINRDKTDNRVENLRWATRKMQYDNSCNFEVHIKPVIQYTLNMVLVAEYPSINEAERQTGISHSKIVLVCQGKRKKAGGYIWKYKN